GRKERLTPGIEVMVGFLGGCPGERTRPAPCIPAQPHICLPPAGVTTCQQSEPRRSRRTASSPAAWARALCFGVFRLCLLAVRTTRATLCSSGCGLLPGLAPLLAFLQGL